MRPRGWPLPLWRRLRWRLLVDFAVVMVAAAVLIWLFLMLLGRSA